MHRAGIEPADAARCRSQFRVVNISALPHAADAKCGTLSTRHGYPLLNLYRFNLKAVGLSRLAYPATQVEVSSYICRWSQDDYES